MTDETEVVTGSGQEPEVVTGPGQEPEVVTGPGQEPPVDDEAQPTPPPEAVVVDPATTPTPAPVGATPAGVPGSEPIPARSAVFRIMEVVSVELALPEQYPVLTLRETEGGGRQLAFRIGLPEGVSLAHSLRGSMAARPLTHDLFADVLVRLSVDVVAVRLVGRFGATYLAELELMGPRGREVAACRPTDGIALALRQRVPAPVLADERLLSTTGDVPGAD